DVSGISNTFTVYPATIDHFGVTDTSGGSIGTQIAGSSFNVKVTAYDAFGNVLSFGPSVYVGKVDVDSNKTCSAGCTSSANFVAGVLASHSITLTQTGSDAVIKVVLYGGVYGTDPSGVSDTFTVAPG